MVHQPDNIPAGTQVVVLVPIRGSNEMLVHPRGAVGIVTRTPTGSEEHFLIRFPDGFESSRTRAEFDVLKSFKDRLTGSESTAASDRADFELEEFVIFRCVTGSRAYGLETETSD